MCVCVCVCNPGFMDSKIIMVLSAFDKRVIIVKIYFLYNYMPQSLKYYLSQTVHRHYFGDREPIL